jgi:galactokinase
VHFSGFNAALVDAIPAGLDLGALEAQLLAFALAVRQLAPFSLTELGADIGPRRDQRGRLPALTVKEKLLLARWCAEVTGPRAEGPASSRLLASLLARPWHAVCLDCRLGTVDQASLVGEVLVLCDSGVRPPPGQPGVKVLRAEWKEAAQRLRARSLRSVELAYLKANRSRLTARQYACAYHAVGEVQRVVHAERALREDDHRQLGFYMFGSHESAREHLGNTCPEVDLLVELARSQAGCLGSRMMGAGFGGATLSLVAYHQVVAFMECLAVAYEAKTGRTLKPLICQMVEGAG